MIHDGGCKFRLPDPVEYCDQLKHASSYVTIPKTLKCVNSTTEVSQSYVFSWDKDKDKKIKCPRQRPWCIYDIFWVYSDTTALDPVTAFSAGLPSRTFKTPDLIFIFHTFSK